MLGRAGILTPGERDAIISGLESILGDIERGDFPWSVALEDVHMNIEARLTERIGEAGKKLHTGRSRNDQVATDIRLYLRDQIEAATAELLRLQQGLLALAEREADRRRVFTRSVPIPDIEGDVVQPMEVTLFDLVVAFKKVLDDLKMQVSYTIERESISIEERIEAIRDMISSKSEVLFTELFRDGFDKMNIIVTFLSILELIRLGEIVARQMSNDSDIWLYRPGISPYIHTDDRTDGTRDKHDH